MFIGRLYSTYSTWCGHTEDEYSYHKCLFCDGYHIGKNKDNKTEYDKIKVN